MTAAAAHLVIGAYLAFGLVWLLLMVVWLVSLLEAGRYSGGGRS